MPPPEATAANPRKTKWLPGLWCFDDLGQPFLLQFFLYSKAGSWNHGFFESLQKKLPAAFIKPMGDLAVVFVGFDFVSKWWFRKIHTYNVQTWFYIWIWPDVFTRDFPGWRKATEGSNEKQSHPHDTRGQWNFPIQSMYDILTYIRLIFMINGR